MSDRIAAAFQAARAEGRPVLGVYLVAGHPDMHGSSACMDAAIDAGADMLEVGIPFGDPVADGPVIQAATQQALQGGSTVQDALDMVQRLRQAHPDTPLVCMTYANILHRMGWAQGARRLADAGFDGVILPDVPLEESAPLRAACSDAGIAWVPLVTPTTSKQRMADIAATATGFLYVVGNVGITGQDDPGPLMKETVARVRSTGTDVPLAVGFGLRSREDVRRVHAAGADGAVVGSAVVEQVSRGASVQDVRAAVAALAGASVSG